MDYLIAKSGNGVPADIRKLVDYLILYKNSEHAELILQKGIQYVQAIGKSIEPSQMYLIEEFFMAALELK